MRIFEPFVLLFKLAIVAALPYFLIGMCGFSIMVAKWLFRTLGGE